MNKDPSGNERYRRWYAAHKEAINDARRQEYDARKNSGLCPRCGTDTKDGSLCPRCLEQARTQQSKKRVLKKQQVTPEES